jgi:hypothetical protein
MVRFVRSLLLALAVGFGIGGGYLVVRRLTTDRRPLPDPPSVVMQVREIARLETLRVSLYKKISFSPEPQEAETFWGDVAGWLRYTFRTPHGKAIVFADAEIGLDVSKLDARTVRVQDRTVELELPPLQIQVVLDPGETEVMGSNLDSAETARLFELAKVAFEREVEADAALRERARASAERALRGLLLSLGFEEVRFVSGPPPKT